jgi:hypothetical protein
MQPEENADKPDIAEPSTPEPERESRYARHPVSGFWYVKARPGAPLITSEQVREWLKDFP